ARGDESMDQRWARILGNPLPEDGVPLEDLLLQLETVMILKALDETNGNQSRAARLLKLDRDKLRYRMKTQNIQKVKS
ncbi:MAG: helix-turn-helix domain-containing protein, partial [Candidatus Krumholzibacteria bacterium]|nr:helix-turn-helix domain-containing protein [Candidatus Krumholzibacteria bacterium]